jgi:hypothetical protein
VPLADEVLADLLRRGERALLRGSSRAIQVSFTGMDSPYWPQSYEQRQHCHVRLVAAEKAGAVQLRWSRQGGDDRPLERVRLVDAGNLAAHLGTATASEAMRAARAILEPWLDRSPRVAELVQAWSLLKSPRGFGGDSAPDFADALRVLDALQQGRGEDQIVRVLSRNLFRDSKRIEALARHIDLLTAREPGAPVRRPEEVFNALGLVKEPQPFLVAGSGRLALEASPDCPVARPFVGVSNRHVSGYSGTPAWVLSIENLTTFHQASQHADARSGLIVYTGGMPSPSWCRAYSAILDCIPEQTPVYHWGDIDQGGFRIAAHLRSTCVRRHAFHPWLMDAGQLDAATSCATTEAICDHMARHARDAGWETLARCLPARTAEQEGIPVRLPAAAGSVLSG